MKHQNPMFGGQAPVLEEGLQGEGEIPSPLGAVICLLCVDWFLFFPLCLMYKAVNIHFS